MRRVTGKAEAAIGPRSGSVESIALKGGMRRDVFLRRTYEERTVCIEEHVFGETEKRRKNGYTLVENSPNRTSFFAQNFELPGT